MSQTTNHTPLDQGSFEQLFKAHFAALCNYAVQYVHDDDSAREIAQKVFINLWQTRETIDPNRPVKSYLYTSVRNRCLNHIRDQKKYRSRVLDLEVLEDAFADDPADNDTSDLEAQIARALDALPEKCRQVFEMSRFQHLKYKDIAAQLDISEKTVEAHMSRALKTLREELKDYAPVVLWLLLGGFYC
jgi:RNA polymerase sigma-70 factor (ECF subfamily)